MLCCARGTLIFYHSTESVTQIVVSLLMPRKVCFLKCPSIETPTLYLGNIFLYMFLLTLLKFLYITLSIFFLIWLTNNRKLIIF